MSSIVYRDRIFETSITYGTGAVSLLGAQTGYQTFSVIGDGNRIIYTIVVVNANGNPLGPWEVGIGTYQLSSNILFRNTVIDGSNGPGKIVDLPVGIKFVYSGPEASDSIRLLAAGDLITYNGTSVVRLPVGSNGLPLVANNLSPTGLNYAYLTSGSIASGAIIGAAGSGFRNIASGTIGTFDISQGAILSGNIGSGQIGQYSLASGIGSQISNLYTASTNISSSLVVMFDSSGNITPYSPIMTDNIPLNYAIGITASNASSGQSVQVIYYGQYSSTSFDFSGYIRQKVWAASGGNASVFPPSLSGNAQQGIGIAIGQFELLINIENNIVITT
jgi:hypothetical protein